MSMYGINAYASNLYYTSLLQSRNQQNQLSALYSKNNKKEDLSSMLSSALKTDPNDLYSLAKKVNLVRSRDYQKELIAGFREYFYGKPESGDTADKTGDKTDSADKTESKPKTDLTKVSGELSKAAGTLAMGGKELWNDPEKTLSSVKNFVDSYNKMFDGLQESDSSKALQKGVTLVNSTNAYSRTLKRIGITADGSNRLKLDENKLKEAAPTTLHSLFSGSYSYAAKVADKASYINKTVDLESKFTYNAKGTKTDMFNQLAASMFSSKV